MSFLKLSKTSSVTYGFGLITPIPPVFNPVSFSPIFLWSFADKSGTITLLSVNDKIDASTPSKNSSITTWFPALPNFSSTIISSTALIASSWFWAIITPFPAASPLAFTTTGKSLQLFKNSFAFSALSKIS